MLRKILVLFLLLVSLDVGARQAAGIASAHPLATRAGEEILRAGGNAFDAAVAVSAALAVVEPYSSGIGGGGFWLLHRASDGYQVMVDGRERAPLQAHRDMYLGGNGEVIKNASVDGPLSAGIPGVAAALEHIAVRYGRLPLADSLQPAIRLARQGFEVEEHYQRMATFRLSALRASTDATRIFLHNGEVPEKGFIIRQPELANTLQTIAEQGSKGFYQGRLATQLVQGVNAAGGIWQAKDLSGYKIVEREPIRGEYRGMKIISAPPPSSGGIAIVEVLNQLSRFDLQGSSATTRLHYVVEAMRRAYRDRAEYLGDTDFVKVPVAMLTDPRYAAGLAATIHPARATPSELLPGVVTPAKAQDTTHFSVMDHDGNRVAATLSINYPFGSCFVAPGTGVLLNDEMDDFSAKPGVPNVYGLVGAEANAIAPGKRMLSSMSPTFLEYEDRIAALGTPGGSRIISMVILGALAFYDGGSAQDIVNLPRYHHQYLPDKVFLEKPAMQAVDKMQLESMGYELSESESSWGNMQAVIFHRKHQDIDAASDKRGIGASVVIE